MFVPTQGRIVQYTLSSEDAYEVNRRRTHASNNKAIGETGFMLHVGTEVAAGDTFPMMITRVWADTMDPTVNGQVFLDGNDFLWVNSICQGDDQGTFREFKRV